MNKIFGKKKLIKDISANTLQTLITQVFGLVIFYLTSKYLSKNDFGELNWSMAVGSTLIAVGSLGLDLVFVKRIASGDDILQISGIHFFHTLIVGIILSLAVYGIQIFVPSFTESHPIFFLIFLNLAIANIANSFKLCLNGLESYKQLAILALCSNTFKLFCIIVLFVSREFTITYVILAYTATSLLEFGLGYILMNRSVSARVKPLLKVYEYKYFILESLPQLGVVLFDSALARIDWILLGILSTSVITAEYSFAYKVFELSKLPLLIISPVLLTRFTKLLGNNKQLTENHVRAIDVFLKIELFIIMFIPIILVCCWTPLIDYFTDNKYGAVNEINYMILALCVPLICAINFLWTLGFVQGQLKTIMFITIIVSVLNIVCNAVLIPFYGSMGSSFSFLACTCIQLVLYFVFINHEQVKLNMVSVLTGTITAAASIIVARLLSNNIIFTSVLALLSYTMLAMVTRQVSVKQLKQVMQE